MRCGDLEFFKLINFKKRNALIQIPVLIVLVLMAAALPVATKLVQNNQDTRNKAVHGCTAGYISSCIFINADCTTKDTCNPPTATPKAVNACDSASNKPNGCSCSSDNVCNSGYCNGFSGNCGVKPTEAPISCGATNETCCANSVCNGSALECVSNKCVYKTPTATPTIRPTAEPTLTCIQRCGGDFNCRNACTVPSCKNNGNLCSGDGDCCSGYCNGFSGSCGVKPTAVPTTCGATNDACCPGSVCRGSALECVSNKCVYKTPTATPTIKATATPTVKATATPTKTLHTKAIGEQCNDDSECHNNVFCMNGFCAEKYANRQVCSSDEQCGEGGRCMTSQESTQLFAAVDGGFASGVPTICVYGKESEKVEEIAATNEKVRVIAPALGIALPLGGELIAGGIATANAVGGGVMTGVFSYTTATVATLPTVVTSTVSAVGGFMTLKGTVDGINACSTNPNSTGCAMFVAVLTSNPIAAAQSVESSLKKATGESIESAESMVVRLGSSPLSNSEKDGLKAALQY